MELVFSTSEDEGLSRRGGRQLEFSALGCLISSRLMRLKRRLAYELGLKSDSSDESRSRRSHPIKHPRWKLSLNCGRLGMTQQTSCGWTEATGFLLPKQSKARARAPPLCTSYQDSPHALPGWSRLKWGEGVLFRQPDLRGPVRCTQCLSRNICIDLVRICSQNEASGPRVVGRVQ